MKRKKKRNNKNSTFRDGKSFLSFLHPVFSRRSCRSELLSNREPRTPLRSNVLINNIKILHTVNMNNNLCSFFFFMNDKCLIIKRPNERTKDEKEYYFFSNRITRDNFISYLTREKPFEHKIMYSNRN